MDLSQSIILPREDYYELLAESQVPGPPMPFTQKLSNAAFVTLTCAGLAATWGLGAWLTVTAFDWQERRASERRSSRQTKSHTEDHYVQ